ncbi:hypothetical protein EDC04DRAFT_2611325 [Pisolithus marmoratus]|nr:hypothetical protein EDC04DRAFT_2611325 [Pisolithus marmoratus]
MSDKSAPLQQLQPPLPSLLSVMQSHSTSTTQASQLPSTSTTGTTPASHTNGLLHHTYLDSLNLTVNAEFHFLTCQICQAALAPVRGITVKHHSKYHPTIPKPPAWHPCKIQQLRKGAGGVQTFWEVQNVEADSQPTLHQSLVDSLLKELEPTLQAIQTPLDGCMVAGKDIKQLCSLVALPKNDDGDIPGLKDVVEAYYEEAIPLLDRTAELVLQRLNSPDPTKSGISNTPFHKHLYKSTMKKYILPVVALLAMLIRQEYTGRPFSGSNNKLMDLLAVLCIDGSEGRDALPLIHEVLFEVWTTAWTPQEDREIVDPTERCLALLTLRQDGSFKEPHDVTGIIAKFKYCMHLTFLQEIHHHIQADPQSDELEHCLALENFFVEKTWGDEIHFGDLCKVFKETEAKLVQIWEEGILMGHDIRVEYDKIADDLINKDVGYSFLSDARNPQLTQQDQLVKKFLQDEATFAHFAMIREGTIIWNRSTLQAWLKSYAELQGLLLNLAVLGRHISLLCQYLKTSTLTGKDKLIPHALDGITSDILVQDLALARPFAEVAARACFPDKPEVVDLYQNHVFVNYNQLFDSKDLSTILTKYSCAIEDIIEMDEEDNVEALQAGHSHSTENQVYVISIEALAGAAEDILPAYLNASMEWQRHCQVPLGGQSTSYKKAHLTPPPPPQAPFPEQREQSNKQPVTYSMPAEEVDRVADAVVKRLPSTDDIAAKVMEKLMPALKGTLQEVLQSSTCHQGQSEEREKGRRQAPVKEEKGFGPTNKQVTSHLFPVAGLMNGNKMMIPAIMISTTRSAQQGQDANDGENKLFKFIPLSPASDAALQAMQALLRNPKATWRSKEQQACMVTVLEGQRDLIAVLGTGAGKSMLAIVPSITHPDRAHNLTQAPEVLGGSSWDIYHPVAMYIRTLMIQGFKSCKSSFYNAPEQTGAQSPDFQREKFLLPRHVLKTCHIQLDKDDHREQYDTCPSLRIRCTRNKVTAGVDCHVCGITAGHPFPIFSNFISQCRVLISKFPGTSLPVQAYIEDLTQSEGGPPISTNTLYLIANPRKQNLMHLRMPVTQTFHQLTSSISPTWVYKKKPTIGTYWQRDHEPMIELLLVGRAAFNTSLNTVARWVFGHIHYVIRDLCRAYDTSVKVDHTVPELRVGETRPVGLGTCRNSNTFT